MLRKLICTKFLLLTTLLLVCAQSFAAEEIRDVHYTTLLPLITNLKPEEAKELETNLVELLQKDKIFQYKTHEGFYQILKNQGPKIKEALYTEEVLKTVANKLLVGSMIRLEVNQYLLGYDVHLTILSKEGKDLYVRKKQFNQKSLSMISNVINFWVQGFTKKTPFHATIVEVQKETILVDYPGKVDELFPNKQFVVVRQIIDPLNTDDRAENVFEEIAYGVVVEINDEFFMGKILEVKGENKILPSDLVEFRIFDQAIADKNDDYKYRQHDLGDYRKHGRFSLMGSLTKIEGSGNSSSFTGAQLGMDFFLPSKMLLMLEFGRRIGQSAGKTNNASKTSGSSLDDSSYKALIGYTYEPKGFQFINYVDFYGGWMVDQHYLSGIGILGVGDVSFEGPMVGIRLEHPIYPKLSALTGVEYAINPKFEERKRSLGDAERTSSYLFQVGARYRFHQTGFCIDGLFRRKSTTASIKNSDMELNIDNNQIFLGISNFF